MNPSASSSSPNRNSKLCNFATKGRAFVFSPQFPNPQIIIIYSLSSVSTFLLGVVMMVEWVFHGRRSPGFHWTVFYAVCLLAFPILCLFLCFLSASLSRRTPPPQEEESDQQLESVSIDESASEHAEDVLIPAESHDSAGDRHRRMSESESNRIELVVPCAESAELKQKDEAFVCVDSAGDSRHHRLSESESNGNELVVTCGESAELKRKDEAFVRLLSSVSSSGGKNETMVEARPSDMSMDGEIIVYLKGLSRRWDHHRRKCDGRVVSSSHNEETKSPGGSFPETGDGVIGNCELSSKEGFSLADRDGVSSSSEVGEKCTQKEEFVICEPVVIAVDGKAEINGAETTGMSQPTVNVQTVAGL